MSDKIKVSAISYLNTLPFLYGIFQNKDLIDNIELTIDYPSQTAQKLLNRQADIGLVPVAVIPHLSDYKIIEDFCISSKDVKSVMLFSQVELSHIEQIFLDYQSLTSVNLLKILTKFFWKKNFVFLNSNKDYETNIAGTTAGLVIGDRALNLLDKFEYQYDLAQQWHSFTGLPFVFALWIAYKQIDNNFLEKFKKSLYFGINNIDKTVQFFSDIVSKVNYDPKTYLQHNISYTMDTDKQKAIELFLQFKSQLDD